MTTKRLQAGDQVPHFAVRNHDGSRVEYSTIWQHRNLLLVAMHDREGTEPYWSELIRRVPAFDEHDTTVVVTADELPGVPVPGLIVADRWGEIVHAVSATRVNDLPPVTTLLGWVEAIEHRCPECEGEAR